MRHLEGAAAAMPNGGLVAVFVHGGNRTFDGHLGLRFTTGRPASEGARTSSVCDYMRQCADDEPDTELAIRLRAAATNIFRDPQYLASTVSRISCDGGGYHSVEASLPLLQHLEGRAHRGRAASLRSRLTRTCRASRTLRPQRRSLTCCSAAHVFPELPVAVIGHGMVRRCLSVVAVDHLSRELVPLPR